MIRVAVLGATGLVGETIIDEIEKQSIPVELKLLASAGSAGSKRWVAGNYQTVSEVSQDSFSDCDYALFAVEGEVSKRFAPLAVLAGCQVIDNSSAYRMDQAVPLVVPEVNQQALTNNQGIISNPNCSTIQSVVPLIALKKYGLKRVIYTTYQSVSGSGKAGIEDLERGLRGETNQFYPRPIANNVIPQIDSFLADGYTAEEKKMIDETRKILDLPELKVTATTVRVPVQSGHSVSMVVETESEFSIDQVLQDLRSIAGVIVYDSPDYPTPLEVAGQGNILVGRVRRDDSASNSLHLWCVADNIRKGAATNAVQILKALLEQRSQSNQA